MDARYLATRARRRPLLDPDGEAARDPTGFVRQLLDVMGGPELPMLAGYRLGPSHASAFSGQSHPCVAFEPRGAALRPGPNGVEAMHAGMRVPFAPTVESAVQRLVVRDRAARASWCFRIHAPVADQLAPLFDCKPSAEWPGYHEGAHATVDQVVRHTEVDCASLDGVGRLLEIAAARKLPIMLREDASPGPCPRPIAPANLTVSIAPSPLRGWPQTFTGWDAEAWLRLELRGDAVVQARVAFGHLIDERVAVAGNVGWSTAVDRELGGARVIDHLVRGRVSRLRALADPAALERWLVSRQHSELVGAVEVETRLGGLVGAGLLGGAFGWFIAPRLLLDGNFAAAPPLVAPSREVQRLGDSDVFGLPCGWRDASSALFVDGRGWLYTVDDCGDEHPLACTPDAILEKLALAEELHDRCETAVVADCDIAAALAARLGLSRVAEASDEISELFVSQNDLVPPLLAVERCRFPRLEGRPFRTLLWAETPELLVAAARAVRELAPESRLGPTDSWTDSEHRVNALRRAGFDRVAPLD